MDERTIEHIENRFSECVSAIRNRMDRVDSALKPATLMVLIKHIEENILRPLANADELPDVTFFGWNNRAWRRERHDEIAAGYAAWASLYGDHEAQLFGMEEQTLIPLLPVVSGKRILDVGCGTGRYAIYFAENGAEVTGVDISPEMIAIAQNRAGRSGLKVEFVIGDVLKFAGEPSHFDLAFSSLAVTHIEDLSALLQRLSRLMRDDGQIWISDIHPVFKMLGANVGYLKGDAFHEVPHFVHTVSDYFVAATRAGLQVERMVEFPKSTVVPMMMAVELRKSASATP